LDSTATRETRKQFLEQLQPLAFLLGHLHGNPGHVSTRMGKTGNDTGSDRITGGHHDRNGVGGFVRGQAGWRTPGHNQVDWKIH
jgi:hypothetical protein